MVAEARKLIDKVRNIGSYQATEHNSHGGCRPRLPEHFLLRNLRRRSNISKLLDMPPRFLCRVDIRCTTAEGFRVLQGAFFLTGASGYQDVVKPLKKLWGVMSVSLRCS